MKEVKNHDGKHWEIRCPECDAWHYVRVLVRAELSIAPGVQVRREWLDEPEIVCAGCEQDAGFLLAPEEKRAILELAHKTV